MAGQKYNITIEQGTCFDIPVTLTDDDGSPYDLRTDAVYLTGVVYRDYDQHVQATFTYNETDAVNGGASMSLSSAIVLIDCCMVRPLLVEQLLLFHER